MASSLCVAVGAYLSVYPLVLLVPIVLLLSANQRAQVGYIGSESAIIKSRLGRANTVSWQNGEDTEKLKAPSAVLVIKIVLSTAVWLASLLYMSYSVAGGWDFLEVRAIWHPCRSQEDGWDAHVCVCCWLRARTSGWRATRT